MAFDERWSRRQAQRRTREATQRVVASARAMDEAWTLFIESDDMDVAVDAIGSLREDLRILDEALAARRVALVNTTQCTNGSSTDQ